LSPWLCLVGVEGLWVFCGWVSKLDGRNRADVDWKSARWVVPGVFLILSRLLEDMAMLAADKLVVQKPAMRS